MLISFRLEDNQLMPGGSTNYFDKVATKFGDYGNEQFVQGGFRVVPPAVARKGSLHRQERRAHAFVCEYRRLC